MFLRNLDYVLPFTRMRGWNLYVFKKRGIFLNTLSREPREGGGWTLKDLELTDEMEAEIDLRMKVGLEAEDSRDSN